MSQETQLSLIGGDDKFQFPARDIWRENGTAKRYADWWPTVVAKYGLINGQDFFTLEVKNPSGRPNIEHLLTSRAADILRTHSTPAGPQHTAAKHDALQSISDRLAAGNLPTSLEIARGLVAALEKIEEQRPKVEFVDRYVESKSAKGIREVGKLLGVPQNEFVAKLEADGIIYRAANGKHLPYAEHQKLGRFEVRTVAQNGRAHLQTMFTPAGIVWAANKYGAK